MLKSPVQREEYTYVAHAVITEYLTDLIDIF